MKTQENTLKRVKNKLTSSHHLMENILNEGLKFEVKNDKLHKFRNTNKALLSTKNSIKRTFMKRIVTLEMHQNRTGSSNSLSGKTFHRSLITLTISETHCDELVK